MNPFQAIMGAMGGMPNGASVGPLGTGPLGTEDGRPDTGGPVLPVPNGPQQPGGSFGTIMQRMNQLAGMFQNPQQMVQRFFPDAPAEMQNDPEQLLGWLQQTGKVPPQMIQMARQMVGR